MNVSEVIDEIQIKSLLVRERYYRDSCQWQKLRDSYHPDASRTSINISWFRGNINGFVSGSEKMAKEGASASHTITPVEVALNGSKALSVSTGSITVRFERNGALYDCVSWARFVSRLEKTAQGWKMLSLEVIYERDSIIPVLPEAPLSEPFVLKMTRRSYGCLAWFLAQKGYVIDESLAGLDWPDSVNKFMGGQYRWLNQ